MIGSGARDWAPAPSHTTAGTIFRIRRLDPAALPTRRKIRRLYQPIALQSGLRQPRMQQRVARHKPGPATRRHPLDQPLAHSPAAVTLSGGLALHANAAKSTSACDAVSNLPAERPSDAPRPAGHIPTSRPRTAATRDAAVRAPDLSHLLLASFHTLRRYFSLPLAVDAKPQKLPLPRPPHSALGTVHSPTQMLLDPVPDPRQHPLRRRLAAHIYVAVVGITAKAQPPVLQFSIQRIQVEVRQQRRQRLPVSFPRPGEGPCGPGLRETLGALCQSLL